MDRRQQEDNIHKSSEEILIGDKKFLDDYLVSHGYNVKNLEDKGKRFVSSLIKGKYEKQIYQKEIKWSHPSVLKLMEENQKTDPIEIIKNKSRDLVLEAFSKGWEGPPFNVIDLAKMNGLLVSPYEMVPDARIRPQDDSFKIEYNPFQSPARINFSIAHEISHTIFSDCADTIRNREVEIEGNSWELEFLCNIGASEILLPYADFSNVANTVDLDINCIIDLARKYNASVESVFLRLCEVIEKPCAIAITSFRGDSLFVDYGKSSRFLDMKIPKGYKIPSNSKAYDCKKARWTSDNLERWEIFKDQSYRVFGIGLSPIKKQTAARVGIFLIPEEFDVRPSKSIYIVFGDATEPRGNGNKIIAQVINTSGALGFGFGKAMATKFPESKKSVQDWKKEKEYFVLGSSRLIERVKPNVSIFQMLAQQGIRSKGNQIPLNYASLRECLQKLRDVALEMNASVHMPAIGAGQAKGDWNIIKGMIYSELILEGVEVTIYFLPGSNMAPNLSRTLTTFLDDEK